MKQISDVETTTSSRPPLASLVMGAPHRRVVRTVCFYHTLPGASSHAHARRRLLRPPPDQRAGGARRRRRQRGGDLSQLSPDDLFEFDQDHYGGLQTVDELASRAGIATASHVLDV